MAGTSLYAFAVARQRLGIAIATVAMVANSVMHLTADDWSTSSDVFAHTLTYAALILGIFLIVSTTCDLRLRRMCSLVIVLWGITSLRFVPIMAAIAIVIGVVTLVSGNLSVDLLRRKRSAEGSSSNG
jgi:hypothetical protein